MTNAFINFAANTTIEFIVIVIIVAVIGAIYWGVKASAKKSVEVGRKAVQFAKNHIDHPMMLFARNDEELYEIVANEVSRKEIRAGLWAKAFAQSGGDEGKTLALYIRLRVSALGKEKAEAVLQQNTSNKEAAKAVAAENAQCERTEYKSQHDAEQRERDAKWEETLKSASLGWAVVGLLILMFCTFFAIPSDIMADSLWDKTKGWIMIPGVIMFWYMWVQYATRAWKNSPRRLTPEEAQSRYLENRNLYIFGILFGLAIALFFVLVPALNGRLWGLISFGLLTTGVSFVLLVVTKATLPRAESITAAESRSAARRSRVVPENAVVAIDQCAVRGCPSKPTEMFYGREVCESCRINYGKMMWAKPEHDRKAYIDSVFR